LLGSWDPKPELLLPIGAAPLPNAGPPNGEALLVPAVAPKDGTPPELLGLLDNWEPKVVLWLLVSPPPPPKGVLAVPLEEADEGKGGKPAIPPAVAVLVVLLESFPAMPGAWPNVGLLKPKLPAPPEPKAEDSTGGGKDKLPAPIDSFPLL
jgi:hypothetical protein